MNAKQLLVKQHTLDGQVYFDEAGAREDLAEYGLPAYFLDFETISFAVPQWLGTRPYQQIPFQFSLHVVDNGEQIRHFEFLDLDGQDPSERLARALVECCRDRGPIFTYNAPFEKSRVKELGQRLPDLADQLEAINGRIVDLLPIANKRYYHPSQEGSWSIKKVLPAIAPELKYDALDGVQDGGMAMEAYVEAIDPTISEERRQQLHDQLWEYCRLDTWALVRLWSFFSGHPLPEEELA